MGGDRSQNRFVCILLVVSLHAEHVKNLGGSCRNRNICMLLIGAQPHLVFWGTVCLRSAFESLWNGCTCITEISFVIPSWRSKDFRSLVRVSSWKALWTICSFESLRTILMMLLQTACFFLLRVPKEISWLMSKQGFLTSLSLKRKEMFQHKASWPPFLAIGKKCFCWSHQSWSCERRKKYFYLR